MAITQMVGARYVTKFYENSKNGTPEWESGVSYEALVCVAYNYGAYVSKIPVPASIGNPAENPSYWAEFAHPAMGLWEELKIRLNQEISNRENGDADLLEKLNQEIADRKSADSGINTTLAEHSSTLVTLQNEIDASDSAIKQLETKLTGYINSIIEKFYGGGTVNADDYTITWGDSGKAPVGNLNIYGNDDLSSYLKTHETPAENDVKVN